VPASSAKQAYSREEVLRLLAVSERQLRAWERQKLISSSESFSFKDLLALRTLAGLRSNHVPAALIRNVLAALREKLADVQDPLAELKIYAHGKKIQVQIGGNKMEPISGQLVLDFDQAAISNLLSFTPKPVAHSHAVGQQKSRKEAERWFEKGLELEHAHAPLEEIIAAYRQATEIDPASAGALVNLGTVYFNARNFAEAECQYRKALDIDGNYALAHFNLGNLFDEMGDRARALTHYLAALQIHSNYADAHYNIALLYQSTNQTMKAVRHWKTYLKLDSTSEWADIARRELSKLRESTIVRGTGSRPHDKD
jgi:tetratricopeptide (TPR) repeat protein